MHPTTTSGLTPSLENYLRAIYALQEEKGYGRVTDIAEELGVAKPAVSVALKTLRAGGLVEHRAYEGVFLTEKGVRRARDVWGKFAVLLEFMTGVLGVSEDRALIDACLMEHCVSGSTVDRLIDLIRFFEDEERQEALEAFRVYRRTCESEDTCPSCSFHCDAVVPGPGRADETG